MAIWEDASEALGRRVNLSRLADKRANSSSECLVSWFYRYLSIRISFAFVLLYAVLLTRYDMLACEVKTEVRREVTDQMCLFGSTYVVRSRRLELEEIHGSKNRPLFRSALHNHQPDGRRESQTYYVHSLLILVLLCAINFASNLLYYATTSYRFRWLFCSKTNCTGQLKYICLLHKWRAIHQSGQLVRFNFCTIYLLGNLVPMFAIVASMGLIHYCLNEHYFGLGGKVVQYYVLGNVDMVEPVRYAFPIATKCELKFFSSSGMPLQLDSLCLLHLNYYNQMVFLFYWFWHATLLLLFTLNIMCRLCHLLWASFRVWKLNGTLNIHRSKLKKNEISFTQYVLLLSVEEFVNDKMASQVAKSVARDKWFARFMQCNETGLALKLNGTIPAAYSPL